MILLTGAAGFIGSNILAALNARGQTDILAVDDLTEGVKCANLAGKSFADYLDGDELLASLDSLPPLTAILHQGACVDTTRLRSAGWTKPMMTLEEGIAAYWKTLSA